MTEGGFCPYKQKSEHAHVTIISLCMCPCESVKPCLACFIFTASTQVPYFA